MVSATTSKVENSPFGTIGTMVPNGRNPRKDAPEQLQVPFGTIMSRQGSLYNFFTEVFASGLLEKPMKIWALLSLQ